jgi:hypothetical protein
MDKYDALKLIGKAMTHPVYGLPRYGMQARRRARKQLDPKRIDGIVRDAVRAVAPEEIRNAIYNPEAAHYLHQNMVKIMVDGTCIYTCRRVLGMPETLHRGPLHVELATPVYNGDPVAVAVYTALEQAGVIDRVEVIAMFRRLHPLAVSIAGTAPDADAEIDPEQLLAALPEKLKAHIM